MPRKAVKAVDPYCTNQKKIENYKKLQLPKQYDFDPQDDSDIEETIRSSSAKKSKKSKKRKARDIEEDDDIDQGTLDRPASVRRYATSGVAIKAKLRAGESYSKFLSRLKREQESKLERADVELQAAPRTPAPTSQKRKRRNEARKEKLKERKLREDSPERKPHVSDVKFGEVAMRPPRLLERPKIKQRIAVTELRKVEIQAEEESKRLAERNIALQREKAILAYQNAKKPNGIKNKKR
eukprot:TRINITY_DN9047_c0_g1_i3.p1 TRINITY_DN9047_c0_g1~~TRINITY_DN9047_c0_g1_i3.p1  ORF type:complete len:239 (-),score=25.86 TRINITY_DN9047_c0_g1_i3:321-1037(-)